MRKESHFPEVNSPVSKNVVAGIFAFQAIAVIGFGWMVRDSLNPDAVAYLQLARHYGNGHWQLAVSGYWSPLISWLTAPGIWLGMNPLIVARVFMGFSAVVFLVGCWRILLHYRIPPPLGNWALGVAALLSVLWSAENISPDLLLAGVVAFAFLATAQRSSAAGIWWGAAFLCKSVALPLGLVVCLAMSALDENGRLNHLRKLIRNYSIMFIGMLLVAGTWVTIISIHNGKLTVSDAARMAHLRAGPGVDEEIYVLDQGFEQPEPGRITTLENPSLHFPEWLPWESSRNALHQLKVIFRNLLKSLVMLTTINLAFAIFLIMAIGGLLRRCNAKSPGASEIGRLWIPVGIVVLLYLPNYMIIIDQRYFYLTFPFLLVLTAYELRQSRRLDASAAGRHIQTALLVLCFIVPNLARSVIYLPRSEIAGHEAVQLASRMSATRSSGSLAGSASLPGGRVGLYLAFLLQQPFYGDKPGASPQEYKGTKARFIVVIRDGYTAQKLLAAQGFENQDLKLFGSASEAANWPVQIFESK